MTLTEIISEAIQVMLPYIGITMVFYYSADIIDLIKKAVGVSR